MQTLFALWNTTLYPNRIISVDLPGLENHKKLSLLTFHQSSIQQLCCWNYSYPRLEHNLSRLQNLPLDLWIHSKLIFVWYLSNPLIWFDWNLALIRIFLQEKVKMLGLSSTFLLLDVQDWTVLLRNITNQDKILITLLIYIYQIQRITSSKNF